MQLRELLNNQPVLTPLVSAKPVGQENSMDAFNQILSEKTNDSTVKRNVLSQRPDPKDSLQRENRAISVRNDKPQFEPLKQSEQNVVKKESVASKENKPRKNEAEPKTDLTQDKIKNMLKDRLKKVTGMSETEIDSMIASVFAEPIKVLELFEANDAFVSELSDIMTSLELKDVLSLEMSPKDMNQMLHQLERLIDSLVKHSDQTNDEVSHADLEQGKAFEMKIVNALSKLVAELRSTNPDESEIKPVDVRKMIVEALVRPEQQTVKNEQSLLNAEVETDSQLLKTVATQSQNQTESDLKQSSSERSQVPEPALPSESNVMTLKVNEAQVQTVYGEEVNVDESAKGNFVHQIMMKHGNTLTTQTVQSSPQQKQEIFSQIMDAIKGHMKLSDNGTSMVIKLQPEQLGNVELKLNLHKGIVLAEIKVENEMVKAAIESNLDDLKQSLSNKGYAIDQLNVSVDSGKKNRQETFGGSRRNKASEKNEKSESVDLIDSVSKYIIDEYEGSTINYYG